MKKTIITLLRAYQCLISPLLGNRCRFHPSCSQYVRDAIEQRGVFKGLWLGCLRLTKCGPWHAGGYDPVTTDSGTVSQKSHT